jgi:hypothetical protein
MHNARTATTLTRHSLSLGLADRHQRGGDRRLRHFWHVERRREAGRRSFVQFADCMRAHGVPSFPDPTGSPPRSPQGNVIGIRGSSQ